MKLCINCRWHSMPFKSVNVAICAHPSLDKPSTVSLVDGSEEKPVPEMCSTMRGEYGKCGIEARLFEVKAKGREDSL